MSSLAASIVWLECAFHGLVSTSGLTPNQHGTQAAGKLSTKETARLPLSRGLRREVAYSSWVLTHKDRPSPG